MWPSTDRVEAAASLTLDVHDQRVEAAEAAEQGLYDFYGISHTSRSIVLPRHGIRVRITETGEGDPVLIVPGNTGDGFPFIPLLPHLAGRRARPKSRSGGRRDRAHRHGAGLLDRARLRRGHLNRRR